MDRERLELRSRLMTFVRASVTSRWGWALAVIHALWFYLGIHSMGPPSRAAADFLDSLQGADWTFFAGRPFHYTYQSWILKFVIVADMPSMLVGALFGLLSSPLRAAVMHVGTYERSYIDAVFVFILGTGQWLIVGHLFQKRFWSRST
jgi:hypothetical protein